MNESMLAIAIADAASAITDGMTTEQMLHASMRHMHNFWLSNDDDLRLRGAIGAVMTRLGRDHPDFAKLEESVTSLKKASAALTAMMAGLHVELTDEDTTPPPFALMQLWHQAKEKPARG